MAKASPEFNAYISGAGAFAQPVLRKVRALFRKACPEIEESIKWGHLTFGHHGIVAGMGAFKEHVRLSFWKGRLLKDDWPASGNSVGMGSMRLEKLSDLPSDKAILVLIRRAAELNEKGVKTARPKRTAAKAAPKIPAALAVALSRNKRAKAVFDAFSPSNRKEYIEWISDAKQEATRQRRLETAMEWMEQGKPRNWKYLQGR
jgi:uncharacterized protein YdeI (YjbR/CyaY-like superfamily)